MNQSLPPPAPMLLPESAPFTPEQRAWLNGFFAGLLNMERGVTALSPEESARLMSGVVPAAGGAPVDADDGEAPWHDPSLSLAERMAMAEGRPLRRRMMAAMAQQDCGQCGYNCHDYSEAIFSKAEARLNLCVPGGKDTNRMLKKLFEEVDAAPAAAPASPGAPADAVKPVTKPVAAPGTARENPAIATFRSRTMLNKAGSQKETYHLEFDLPESGLSYAVGDAFGLYPTNDPDLVDDVLAAIGAPADFPIGGRKLRDVLLDSVSLSPAPDMLFQLLSYLTGGERRQKAKALASGEDPDGDAATLDVLAALEKFSGVRPDPEAFVEALDPLQPRLYSISSSPRLDSGRIALTVDSVRYDIGRRKRLGVASTFLADRLSPGDTLKVYVQKAEHFSLPEDPATPVIMIGPGTGIAPFRAFLYDRMATGASGKNWLFFGHQRRDCDFFYEDELTVLKAKNVLTRLSLAWSRDADQKFYVQDRMRQVGRDVWSWLAEGAYLYVCGDAKRMAKDVEEALVDIVAQHGARSRDQAIAFVSDLKKSGRYRQDVY